MSEKKWIGSTKCDICKTECTEQEYFVDAVMRGGGWALMCPSCFSDRGTNFGQKYGPDKVKIGGLHGKKITLKGVYYEHPNNAV